MAGGGAHSSAEALRQPEPVSSPAASYREDSSPPGSSADTESSQNDASTAAIPPAPSPLRSGGGTNGATPAAGHAAALSGSCEAAIPQLLEPPQDLWQPTEEVLHMVVRWLHSLDEGVYHNRLHGPAPGRPAGCLARQYLSVHKVAALLAGAYCTATYSKLSAVKIRANLLSGLRGQPASYLLQCCPFPVFYFIN